MHQMSRAIVEISSILKHELYNMQLLYNKESDKIKDEYYSVTKLNILPLLKYYGCKFSNDACYHIELMELYKSCGFCFIYGAKGNDKQEAFDLCEINGRNLILIFMDYFRPLIKQTPDEILGYSPYMDEICNICDLMLSLIGKWDINDRYTDTIQASTARIMPYLGAVMSVAGLVTLNDNDMSGLKVSDALEILDSNVYPITFRKIRS